MRKKNIFFYGFDPHIYMKKIWDLLKDNDKFNAFKFNYELEDPEKVIKLYDDLKFKDFLAPSIHSSQFQKYFLSIQRRRGKDIELHESYCEWQILFSYFLNLLREKNIDIMIFANCPHQGIDTVLWYAAKEANIETAFFWQVPLFYSLEESHNIYGKFLFSSSMDDFELIYKNKDFKTLDKKVNLNENYRNLTISFLTSKKKKNAAFYEFLRTNKFYLFVGKYTFNHFARHVFALLTLKKSVRKHISYLKNLVESISIKNENELDSFKPYIYFPLHQQPELSTSVLGGEFTEISDAIVLLAKYAKDRKINILVKENPKQTHMQRSKNFFRRLLKNHNVKFVSTSLSAEILIGNSSGIATITGTTAIEAIFSNKYSLVFGNPWFKKCDAFFSYENDNDILRFLDAIELGDLNNGADTLNEFLFELSPKLCDGVVDPHYLTGSQKENFNITLSETYKSILKCLNLKFVI